MIKENFIEMIETSICENWDLLALQDYFKNQELTYGQMAERIAKLHLLFRTLEVTPGDKIAIIGRNNLPWAVTFMAVVTYGAVVVPILQEFNANDVQHILNHSDSVVLFASEQNFEAIELSQISELRASFSLADFSMQYVSDNFERRLLMCDMEALFVKQYPEGLTPDQIAYHHTPNTEMVLLSYTSGTTGFSKGVMLSGNNLAGNVNFGKALGVHFPGSRVLSFLPLAHAYGLMFDFIYPLCVGARVTMLGKIPSPKVLLQALAEVKPNVIFMVPLIIEKIYKKQLLPLLDKNVTKIALHVPLVDAGIYTMIRKKLVDAFGGQFSQVIIGGAALNGEVEEFLARIKFPFTVGYGMTECAPLISYSYPAEFINKSCGRALPKLMEVKVVDREPLSGVGKLYVRGENVMMGYYKNEEATRAVLDQDGWLSTGDMGSVSDDGTIFIRGRNKTMILRSNGQNIYPEEIESKLNNLPCVMESLVMERDGKLVALVYPDYDVVDSLGVRDQNLLGEIMKVNVVELNRLVAPY
ncbi:MAG: AMP-binding protein, partial [Mucinivorans sp.]